MASVLGHIARENHETDETLIRAALASGEKPTEKADASETNKGMILVNELQKNLDDFLQNYESESEEEEEACALSSSTQQCVRDMTPEFQCCVCHSSVCESEGDIPCLLVHEDNFSHPSWSESVA